MVNGVRSHNLLARAIVVLFSTSWAFQTPPSLLSRHSIRNRQVGSQLHFFGRNRGNITQDSERTESRSFSFFSRGNSSDDVLTVPPATTTSQEETATEVAARMKADAQKIRLEATLMEAQLNIQKIKALEKELQSPQNRTKEEKEKLQANLDSLSRKLNKKEDTPELISSEEEVTSSVATDSDHASAVASVAASPSDDIKSGIWRQCTAKFDEEEFRTFEDYASWTPDIFLGLTAGQLGVELDTNGDFNRTELLRRTYTQFYCRDFSFSQKPEPSFTKEEIDTAMKNVGAIRSESRATRPSLEIPTFLSGNGTSLAVEALSSNPNLSDEDVALLSLEYSYYVALDPTQVANQTLPFGIQVGTLEPEALEESLMEQQFTTFLPKSVLSTEKESPTEAEVQKLVKIVLPKAKFSASAQPRKVPGGWIVKGSFQGKDGNEFVDLLDAAMDRNLADKMTVSYLPDFTAILGDQALDAMMDGREIEPILFVSVPNPARESRPVQLSIVTALGIATCWYLSLYPFLLNSAIASRVDEELALIDAGMSPNLNWLTDLTLPLFASFLAIQAVHELAHFLVAQTKGVSRERLSCTSETHISVCESDQDLPPNFCPVHHNRYHQ